MSRTVSFKQTKILLTSTLRNDTSRAVFKRNNIFLAYADVIDSFFKTKDPSGLGLKGRQFEFSITICGEQKIRSLNNTYRQKNKITDVLSFPVHDNLRQEGWDNDFGPCHLGDIIICFEVAKRQASEYKVSIEQELLHLAVHGLLHLCGFDHEISAAENKVMVGLEQKLIKQIYKKCHWEK